MLILIFTLAIVITSTGCNKKGDPILKHCSEIVLELVCLSYDNYGDYSKLPDKYNEVISKELFEKLNYRDYDYNEICGYGEYGTDYYAVNSVSYPVAEYDDDDIVVSYIYSYETKSYDNGTNIPVAGSFDIPVRVTLRNNNGKYCVIDYYEKPQRRFINADDNEYICASGAVLSANIFIYCENNTISSYDPNGNFSIRGTIRDLVRLISCNDYSLSITKSNNKYIKELFKIAGFYKDKKGIFHTYQDCLQQYGGYNSLYDIIFDLGTSMKAVNFPFTCRANNKEYIFWAWKGDYLNLGAGAELGFYKRLKILGYKTDHWVVDQNFKFKMSMVLKHKGKKIINYAPKKHKWWLTGFNPNKQNVKATDLSVKYTVYFENHKNIFKSFYDTWKKHKKMEKWKKWSFYPQKYKAVLKF